MAHSPNFQNAHAEIIAPQRARPNRRVFAAVAGQSGLYSSGSRSRKDSCFGPHFRFAVVGAPQPCSCYAGLAHGGPHHTRGNLIRGEPALEQSQPFEQFGEKFIHFLANRRFTHRMRGGKTSATPG